MPRQSRHDPRDYLEAARLYQLWLDLNPKRIAARFGWQRDHVRRVWLQHTLEQLRSVTEEQALQIMVEMRHDTDSKERLRRPRT